jgi:hypothetical protein
VLSQGACFSLLKQAGSAGHGVIVKEQTAVQDYQLDVQCRPVCRDSIVHCWRALLDCADAPLYRRLLGELLWSWAVYMMPWQPCR